MEKIDSKNEFIENEQSLSTSTSADSNDPIPLTESNFLPGSRRNSHIRRNSSRRSSVTSFHKSLDVLRKSITGDSSNACAVDIDGYSVKDIYGDLDSDQINVKRTATRNTILSELIARNHELEDYDLSIDDEKEHVQEAVGETTIGIENYGDEFNEIDPELITWNGKNDPEDPRNWPKSTKIQMIALVSFYALVAPMSSSILSPAMSEISVEFGIKSQIVQAMVVSIQILSWAIGPLIIAPLSENDSIGRKLVLDVSVWLSFFFNLGCAFSQNTAQMMICRFIGGLFGCVPMNVCAGVISDLYDANGRNWALAGYSLAPVLGPVIAPLVGGFIVENMDWRWVFYVLCIFNGAVAVVALIFFKETYTPTLLKRKAQKIRKLTGNESVHTIYEITDGETFFGKMYVTMTRPVKLLFTHPMIVGLGSFMAFIYGFMYLMIVAFPKIFFEVYGFNKGITGLMYLPMGFGFVFGIFFWTWAIGRTYKKLVAKNNGVGKPEFRLPMLIVCSSFIPIGLIWFGWSAEKKLHWIMPGIGSAFFAFALVCAFQTIQSYLIDMSISSSSNGSTEVLINFSASSVAAAALFRSLFGFSFPLFANKMYESLGYGWANTMCAFIAIALGIPFPILCYLYGERIRHWANKRIERDQLRRDERNLIRLQKKNLQTLPK